MLQAGLQMGNRDQSELVGPTLVGKKNEDYAGTAQWALAPKSVPMGHGPFSVDLLIPKRTKMETLMLFPLHLPSALPSRNFCHDRMFWVHVI